ncbi:MAG TPA: periplasmic heavy metal sensor [Bryobacteraceae bacterium]|nr:periplasmic heavy metal sensor [Bryobacteraceae bacterium]
MLRTIFLLLAVAGALCAQMPKGMYAWWSRPEIRRDLKLTPDQQRQIQSTVRQFRPRLIDIRAAVEKAEIDLQAQFDHDPVDPAKTNQAIDRLITARGDLTRTLSELSLRLRMLLTEQQWQELQRRRPLGPGPVTELPPQK